jgi:hypothetical protein
MKAPSRSARVKAVAKLTGKSVGTIWRWARQGCDLNSPASINEHLEGNRLRQHANLIRKPTTKSVETGTKLADEAIPDLSLIELGPVGPRGAAAALARLEIIEERAHARLLQAIENGNPHQIKAAQEFYLRASETLRRLDLAVETERRNAEEQVPQKQVEAVALYVAEWLRIAFAQFLSSESRSLMGIKDPAEFKLYAVDRLRGIVYSAVKTSRKTNSSIPTWAEAKVIEAIDVPVLAELGARMLNLNVVP